jgi:hypothetical protein
MLVTMKVGMTGTRDGEDWPGIGEVVDLPDAEANDLIAADMAAPAAKAAAPVVAAAVEAPENAATSKVRARKSTAPKV